MHDGISFEQFGKPAAVICTPPFRITARNIAKTMGLPDYPFALVDHPIGSRSDAELADRAKAAFPQCVKILTERT